MAWDIPILKQYSLTRCPVFHLVISCLGDYRSGHSLSPFCTHHFGNVTLQSSHQEVCFVSLALASRLVL